MHFIFIISCQKHEIITAQCHFLEKNENELLFA